MLSIFAVRIRRSHLHWTLISWTFCGCGCVASSAFGVVISLGDGFGDTFWQVMFCGSFVNSRGALCFEIEDVFFSRYAHLIFSHYVFELYGCHGYGSWHYECFGYHALVICSCSYALIVMLYGGFLCGMLLLLYLSCNVSRNALSCSLLHVLL